MPTLRTRPLLEGAPDNACPEASCTAISSSQARRSTVTSSGSPAGRAQAEPPAALAARGGPNPHRVMARPRLALRLTSVDLHEGRESLWLRRAIRKEHGRLVEAELKTHQQRRIALDPESAAILREHIERLRTRAAALGYELPADAFLFSGSPDGSTFPVPDSVTQRYERLAGRLGIATTFHRLRHYSATELIAGGVDPRTVAGRLGHSGGGTTTLKTYSAWVSEADQRAAKGIGARMPERPADHDPAEGVRTEPRHPCEVTAAHSPWSPTSELRPSLIGCWRNAASTRKRSPAGSTNRSDRRCERNGGTRRPCGCAHPAARGRRPPRRKAASPRFGAGGLVFEQVVTLTGTTGASASCWSAFAFHSRLAGMRS
jgi:hypothetical protein